MHAKVTISALCSKIYAPERVHTHVLNTNERHALTEHV